MQISVETFTVNKRFPLTISRGTTAQTTNILVRIEQDEIEGWGEASPFSIVREDRKNTDELLKELEQIIPTLEKYSSLDRQEIEKKLQEMQVSSSLRAAIDTALHDWLGKRAGLPLWRLWGLNRDRIVPTSVTIGINTPQGARKRVKDWIALMGAKLLKVKLGSPEGIEADRAMLLAIREEAPHAQLTVDANGGWNLEGAMEMCDWLAQQGVKYVEQPLPVGEEKNLSQLRSRSPIPIFVDESCFSSGDIPRLANCADGINIKLMKAGGLTEVMRSIHVAKACGLQIMFGCYSDSSLANTAMSHLAPLADYLDLDSHLNLADDPFAGAILEEGRLLPNDLPGLGVQYRRNLAPCP
ncbi:enolase superfamily enzyme related to L-alanine-DL-glutamate epimerase [Pleurocapsa sp. PCC 7327]|uniref:dipeptide epimerase n=1 Tax=Pleurocapsa sp. PCC 7327 TaxID=118163 RepID=UPI00029FB9E9|nr:dipeptide epimerase [Pleurocapsa sp. PCC 7327]AFY76273.1 enolase superfamily enzyme related to L-alanine-DL-glutamate epimerase [Pleurocapsa sp. PCC 7327]